MQTSACCTCTVHISGVVEADLDLVWTFVKSFGDAGKWLTEVPGVVISTALLADQVDGKLGALRTFSINGQSFVEKLEALDDVEHTMRWKVISHPTNRNPFPGSYVNSKTSVGVRKITMGNTTLVEWRNEFDTEYEHAATIKSHLKAMFEGGILGLRKLLNPTPAGVPSVSSVASLATVDSGRGWGPAPLLTRSQVGTTTSVKSSAPLNTPLSYGMSLLAIPPSVAPPTPLSRDSAPGLAPLVKPLNGPSLASGGTPGPLAGSLHAPAPAPAPPTPTLLIPQAGLLDAHAAPLAVDAAVNPSPADFSALPNAGAPHPLSPTAQGAPPDLHLAAQHLPTLLAPLRRSGASGSSTPKWVTPPPSDVPEASSLIPTSPALDSLAQLAHAAAGAVHEPQPSLRLSGGTAPAVPEPLFAPPPPAPLSQAFSRGPGSFGSPVHAAHTSDRGYAHHTALHCRRQYACAVPSARLPGCAAGGYRSHSPHAAASRAWSLAGQPAARNAAGRRTAAVHAAAPARPARLGPLPRRLFSPHRALYSKPVLVTSHPLFPPGAVPPQMINPGGDALHGNMPYLATGHPRARRRAAGPTWSPGRRHVAGPRSPGRRDAARPRLPGRGCHAKRCSAGYGLHAKPRAPCRRHLAGRFSPGYRQCTRCRPPGTSRTQRATSQPDPYAVPGTLDPASRQQTVGIRDCPHCTFHQGRQRPAPTAAARQSGREEAVKGELPSGQAPHTGVPAVRTKAPVREGRLHHSHHRSSRRSKTSKSASHESASEHASSGSARPTTVQETNSRSPVDFLTSSDGASASVSDGAIASGTSSLDSSPKSSGSAAEAEPEGSRPGEAGGLGAAGVPHPHQIVPSIFASPFAQFEGAASAFADSIPSSISTEGSSKPSIEDVQRAEAKDAPVSDSGVVAFASLSEATISSGRIPLVAQAHPGSNDFAPPLPSNVELPRVAASSSLSSVSSASHSTPHSPSPWLKDYDLAMA
eukprot:jgi/Botrbrau1/5653/Bobra.55_1s0041.1